MTADHDKRLGNGVDRNLDSIFEAITQPELKAQVIDAIRAYRTSVKLAEDAREARIAGEGKSKRHPKEQAELQRIHLAAEIEHRARQLVLNNLIDRLGYVPKVPQE